MRIRTRQYFVIVAALALVIVSVPSVLGYGIGFQASFPFVSEVVAPYQPTVGRFSAALYPKTLPHLSNLLDRLPQLESSRFDDKSMRFTMDYNRTAPLVPISVDGPSYYLDRSFRQEQAQKDTLMQKYLRQSKSKGRSGKLSIGVPLPKRVERFVGEGGGNLTVSGSEHISFAGRSQWRDGASSDTYKQSKFPALNMDQISRFEISGTVGTKISVRVSQDNQTDIPLANRIQIRYKGDEDDILRTVEAGNTTLSLPNTQFIGYSRSIQGLFGIKMEAAVGGLKLTAIASQEKGTSEHASVSATTEQGAKTTRDALYAQGRIFDLFSGDTSEMKAGDSITNIKVYEEVPTSDTLYTRYPFAQALVDPNRIGDSLPHFERYRVKELDPTPFTGSSQPQFAAFDDSAKNLHYIIFNYPRTRYGLAVYYQFRRKVDGRDTIITVGDISSKYGEYKLKKIHASYNRFVASDPSWNMMWRNCYDIPLNSNIAELDIKVFKGLPGTEEGTDNLSYQLDENSTQQFSYLTILGLDLYKGGTSTRQPDGKVDDVSSIFKPEWGLLILPNRFPFSTDTTYRYQGGQAPELSEKVPELYESSDQLGFKSSKYYFQFKAKTRSSIIRLNRTNVIEGSERLTLNNRPLVKNVDYAISYEIGQITLLKEEALDPNAQLSIDFEFAPFLALQKKTLFGMRAEYEVNKDLRIGSTFLYKSDKAEQRKPRVGQETSRGTVEGVDFSLGLRPHFFTKMINALPLVTSDAPSTMAISGEVAQSRPNPNVDGVAYVDDFEGTIEQVSIGTSRVNWRLSSVPEQIEAIGDNALERRGRLLWFSPPSVPWDSVYKGQRQPGTGLIQILRLIYRPNTVGLGPLDTTADGIHWAGIQTPIHPLDQDRLRLFEIRMRGPNRGKLHVDIGRISEDINNDGVDTRSENFDGNRHVEQSEDVGFDGVPSTSEPGYNADTLPDPNRDNFAAYLGLNYDDPYFNDHPPPVPPSQINDNLKRQLVDPYNLLAYEWINGTEGNLADAAAGDVPDCEAQVGSTVQLQSNYYAYTVDLADSIFLVDSSRNEQGWRTYRIPIRDTLTPGFEHLGLNGQQPGPFRWDEANYVRIWFESEDSVKDTVTVDVANWYFVQSSWKDTVYPAIFSRRKPRFYAATVSEEENNNFTPPPGVEAYRDPTSNIVEAQKAMALVYDSVHYHDTCMTVKDLLSVDSYTGYRKMQMYVHGPVTAGPDSVKFFFRLGTDQKNFYEYQTMLEPGWAQGNWVDIDFNAMTAWKDTLIRFRDTTRKTPFDSTSGRYRVKGSPNLNQIKFLACGIVSEDSLSADGFMAGEVWVDELRVTNVRSDVGTAARLSVSGTMADLLNYSFSYQEQDPYFRGLAAATRGGSQDNLGSGRSDKNFIWSLGVSLHKFLPRSWNASLPFSMNASHSKQLPLLSTNSDIVLPENARQAERFTSDRSGFSISEGFSKKTRNPVFSLFLNRQHLGFAYSKSLTRTPGVPYSLAEQYSVRGDYDLGYAGFKPLNIFFWTKPIPYFKQLATAKFSYYPSSWRVSGNYSRSLSVSEDNKATRTSSFRRDLDANMNLEYKVFQNITVNYTYNTRRDLTDTADVRLSLKKFHPGLETSYGNTFRTGWAPTLFKFVSTSFSYGAGYNENYDRQSQSRRGNMNNNWSLGGTFNHVTLFGGGGASTPKSTMPQMAVPKSTDPKAKAAQPKAPGKPFYDLPRTWLRKLTSWIKPIQYRYQKTYNSSTPGMIERPRFAYQLGFYRSAGVPLANQSSSQPLSNEGKGWEASSGFMFLGGLGLDVKFKRDLTRDLIKVGDRTERTSSSWPDLIIQIQPFKTLPLFKGAVNKFIKVFTPRTAYSRQLREENNLTRGFTTSKAKTIARSPLLAINFKLFRALSMTATYSTSSTETRTYSSIDGRNISLARSRQKSFIVTSQYSFSAPGGIGIPLFGKLKFNSLMTVSTDIRFNSTYSEAGTENSPIAKGKDATDFVVAPTVGYQFSPQIKGGLTARWQDSRDASNFKSHSREVRLWAEIRF